MQLVLAGLVVVLAVANFIMGILVASYATRTDHIPFPFDLLAGIAEVYGDFWSGQLDDEGARNTILTQFGCALLMLLAFAAFMYVPS